ncbi:precorrin-2 dehydrogenase / sirohydrochlorin ferrochelatase [Seinonella peptonophila]|uniref:precorrin-2 dehydrogenase n=1 Tax=Seinonella peptonophila TaxID=112248 RepID=A0A1M4TUU1_9BACL|nr:NAD(P)-dependent oxidoreductase [Seinonella peptonophila]SHE48164.1 precorrin-2 dehydrogenase / sirohydrochlorin ferrochelatase [Seinonella peptonophila]
MTKMYPMMISLTDRNCLVVGGGRVAERKVHSLIESGARVKIVSPTITESLKQQVKKGNLQWEQRLYHSNDGQDAFLVIAATDWPHVNKTVYEDAIKRNQWINVVDQPELCNFTVPSVMRQGKLTIAISTQGASPMFSKRIRQDLEQQYGDEFSLYIDLLGEARKKVQQRITDRKERQRLLQELMSDDWLDLCRYYPTKVMDYFQAWLQEQIEGQRGGKTS